MAKLMSERRVLLVFHGVRRLFSPHKAHPGRSLRRCVWAVSCLQDKVYSGTAALCGWPHVPTMRRLSQSSPGGAVGGEDVVEAWFGEVGGGGRLCVVDMPCDVSIEPLNPVDFPDVNRAAITLRYTPGNHGSRVSGDELSRLGRLCGLQVDVSGGRMEVSGSCPPSTTLPLTCRIIIPIKFDVEVRGSSGQVTISRLESDRVQVHLEKGDCHLVSLKTAAVDVQCDSGDIVCGKQLLGDISLRCGSHGGIRGDRLQGGSVRLSTQDGNVSVSALYCHTAVCQSQTGHLHIRDCHGDVTAGSDSGDIKIGSLDGRLSAELRTGSADVFVARQEGMSLNAQQGDITLRFAEDASCSLDLTAAAIDDSIPATLDPQGKGHLRGTTEAAVRASAPGGKICLKTQDWLSSVSRLFRNTEPA